MSPACEKNGRHCLSCIVFEDCMTCCECGQALVPWHPEIEGMVKDGLFRG